MNPLRFTSVQLRGFSSSPIPWISPIQLSRPVPRRPDPPTRPEYDDPSEPRRKESKHISHEAAIKSISRERDPQRALEMFNSAAEQKGFSHNNGTYSAILHSLARSKKFKAVDSILRQMAHETCRFHEPTFLNLMTHFARSSLPERALEMFHAIRSIAREKPSLKAVSTCLNVLVEAGRLDLARELLLYCRKNLNLRPNTCIFNIIVKHHCRRGGDIGAAFGVVDEMKKGGDISYPNLITYSTLMHGLCQSGRLREAVELFEEMVSGEKIVPDALTYNVMIGGFCAAGEVAKARLVLDFMRRNGCRPNVFNYSALLSGFCRAGAFREAEGLFDEMRTVGPRPDRVSYTAMIDGFCRAGRVDFALELLREMRESESESCRPDAVTFNVVLGGLCREGRVEEAVQVVERAPHEGVSLNKGSYRIVLNFLCQRGEVKKGAEFLDLMLGRGFVPHFATSNDLLVRLCGAGMVSDAVVALSGLVEMGFRPDPDCWEGLVESVLRERKLLSVFQLLDELV